MFPETAAGTGRITWSLEITEYGAVPPVTEKLNGTPEYPLPEAGVTVSGPAPGWKGLFGAPPPPPQAASESTPTIAATVRSRRNHAVNGYPGMMVS